MSEVFIGRQPVLDRYMNVFSYDLQFYQGLTPSCEATLQATQSLILKIQDEEIKWALKPINFVLNHFGNGEVQITPRGSFKIGRITMQRKGGDGGRPTANMLQFKINPCEILDN